MDYKEDNNIVSDNNNSINLEQNSFDNNLKQESLNQNYVSQEDMEMQALKEKFNEFNSDIEEENEEKKKELRKKLRNYHRKNLYDVLLILLFIFILIEAFVGFIDLQNLSKGKKPLWYLNKKEVKISDENSKTTYNLGLYKIVVTDTTKTTKTELKPFFLKD